MCKNLQQMAVMDVTDPKIGRNEDYKMHSILKKTLVNNKTLVP
jgi:hypothetical protein